MVYFIVGLLFAAILLLLLIGRKNARKAPSKLSINDHPAMFERPTVEHVEIRDK